MTVQGAAPRRSVVGFIVLVSLAVVACGDGSAARDSALFFPTTPEEQGGASMTTSFQGPIVVKDGCVLVGQAGEYSLPLWWSGFTAEPGTSGRIVVRDADGAVVAIEGDAFEMGGGYTAEFYPGEDPPDEQITRVEEWLGYQIPDRCLTPDVYGIWVVGETEPLRTSSTGGP
jgi:hypothetical protein